MNRKKVSFDFKKLKLFFFVDNRQVFNANTCWMIEHTANERNQIVCSLQQQQQQNVQRLLFV